MRRPPPPPAPPSPDQLMAAFIAAIAPAVAAQVVAQLQPRLAAPPSAPASSGTDATEWLDEKAAAAYLGVKPKFLQEHRAAGDGPTFRRCGARAIRYARTDLENWMRRARP